MRLATRLKPPVPYVEIRLGEATAFLLVVRYDWTKSAERIIERLHQEDLCQALSMPPEQSMRLRVDREQNDLSG